jgi:hypothetical protein
MHPFRTTTIMQLLKRFGASAGSKRSCNDRWPRAPLLLGKPENYEVLERKKRGGPLLDFRAWESGRALQPCLFSIACLVSRTRSPDQLQARLPQRRRSFLRVDLVGLHQGPDNRVGQDLVERWFAMTPIHRWTPARLAGGGVRAPRSERALRSEPKGLEVAVRGPHPLRMERRCIDGLVATHSEP